MAESVVGLEITSQRLLAVEIAEGRSAHPKILRAHSVALDDGVARDSEVLNITQASAVLRQLWDEGRFRSRRVVLGIGNQRVLVREHEVPEMPASQLREALPYRVADLLPVAVSETILDFYPVEPVEEGTGSTMRGLLVAVMKDTVETNVATLHDAKLKVVGVDLAPFAIVRTVTKNLPSDEIRTIVHIGSRTTYVVIVRGGVPLFVRIVAAGGLNVTDAVVEHLSVDAKTAEQVKQRFGVRGGTDPKLAAVTEAIVAALGSILRSVRSTNTYFTEHHAVEPPTSLVLSGRDSTMPGMAEAAGRMIGLPVQVLNPVEGLALDGSIDGERFAALAPSLTIPIGLTIGGR